MQRVDCLLTLMLSSVSPARVTILQQMSTLISRSAVVEEIPLRSLITRFLTPRPVSWTILAVDLQPNIWRDSLRPVEQDGDSTLLTIWAFAPRTCPQARLPRLVPTARRPTIAPQLLVSLQAEVILSSNPPDPIGAKLTCARTSGSTVMTLPRPRRALDLIAMMGLPMDCIRATRMGSKAVCSDLPRATAILACTARVA